MREDEYDLIFSEEAVEEAIEEIKQTFDKGPCNNCGKQEMVLGNNCYYCLVCGFAEDEHTYLYDLAGFKTIVQCEECGLNITPEDTVCPYCMSEDCHF